MEAHPNIAVLPRPEFNQMPMAELIRLCGDVHEMVGALCHWWNGQSTFIADHFEIYRVTDHGLQSTNPDNEFFAYQDDLDAGDSFALVGMEHVFDFRAVRKTQGVWVAVRDDEKAIHSLTDEPDTFAYWSEISLRHALPELASAGLLDEAMQARIIEDKDIGCILLPRSDEK